MTEEQIWKVQKPIELMNLEAHKSEQTRMHMQKQILNMIKDHKTVGKTLPPPNEFSAFFNVGIN